MAFYLAGKLGIEPWDFTCHELAMMTCNYKDFEEYAEENKPDTGAPVDILKVLLHAPN